MMAEQRQFNLELQALPPSYTSLDDHGQPSNPYFNRSRRIERAVDELIGLCRGMQADGIVNLDEARYLSKWLERNREIAAIWPANQLSHSLREFLRNPNPEHPAYIKLSTVLRHLTGEGFPQEVSEVSYATMLPFTIPFPPISFPERYFCFTGRFQSGTRKQCEEAALMRGGFVERRPTRRLDYLVIGEIGSRDWIHSTYGRKIEEAMAIRERSGSIVIVPESHWQAYL